MASFLLYINSVYFVVLIRCTRQVCSTHNTICIVYLHCIGRYCRSVRYKLKYLNLHLISHRYKIFTLIISRYGINRIGRGIFCFTGNIFKYLIFNMSLFPGVFFTLVRFSKMTWVFENKHIWSSLHYYSPMFLRLIKSSLLKIEKW